MTRSETAISVCLALSALAVSCGEDEAETSELVCGAGTELVSGECVAITVSCSDGASMFGLLIQGNRVLPALA